MSDNKLKKEKYKTYILEDSNDLKDFKNLEKSVLLYWKFSYGNHKNAFDYRKIN